MKPAVLGIDIGGANLKLATASGTSRSAYFPMWTDHPRLAEVLRELLQQFSSARQMPYQQLAVTMTGEMADCFASRADGVRAILDHVEAAACDLQIFVYGVDGSWLSPSAASQDPWRVASSNWHALASWLVRAPGVSDAATQLVVDIGSTTVDVIPVNAQQITTTACTDGERLQRRQLVYTGMSRTPIAAILSQAKINGAIYPLLAERFATSDDAYVVLGLVPAIESTANRQDAWVTDTDASTSQPDTADGRSRSVPHARARLARMLGEDSERLLQGEIEALAQQVVAAQAARVAEAIQCNLATASTASQPGILFSGHGRCLAERALELLPMPVNCRYLEDLISPAAARCGPAAAVAWLLDHREA